MKQIENTIMFNTIAATFKITKPEAVKNIVITMNRGKETADSGDRFIVTRNCDKVDPK